jgi:hypothetical protein
MVVAPPGIPPPDAAQRRIQMQLANRAIVMAVGAALVLTGRGIPRTSAAEDTQRVVAEAGEGPECSNHTLRGDYAFTIDGTILAGPARLLLRGLAMTHFDGEGGLNQVDFATIEGAPAWPDWRPATGTYHVNADCTGSAEIVPAAGPSIPLRLVLFDGGRQVATVVVGNATGSLGRRVR